MEKNEKTLTRNDALSLFRELSWSQGFYGRLIRNIYLDPEWGNMFLKDIESHKFTNTLDLILYVEGAA